MKIKDVKGEEILTTAGTSTVRISISIDNIKVSASVPQGTSRSIYEAGNAFVDPSKNYKKGFVGTINQKKIDQSLGKIKDIIVNKDLIPNKIDAILSDMENEKELNSSVILATSIATHRAEAIKKKKTFSVYLSEKIGTKNFTSPAPLINIINGGLHTSLPTITFQEILLVPIIDKNYTSPITILFKAQTIFYELQKLLKEKSIFYGFGLEGGISAQWEHIDQPINFLINAIEKSGFRDDFNIGFDCAASTWFDTKSKKYNFFRNQKQYTSENLIKWYEKLTTKYPITYLEDPFVENDHDAWKELKKISRNNFCIAGDDICATKVNYIEQQEMQDMIHGVIIKPSQAGTVTKTINAIKSSNEKNFHMVTSHRSCETEDNFIIDLIFASNPRFCKLGNITQGCISKYNTLIKLYGTVEK